jgi:hypothetical protein
VLRLTETTLYFFDRLGAEASDKPNDTGTRVRKWLRTLGSTVSVPDDKAI